MDYTLNPCKYTVQYSTSVRTNTVQCTVHYNTCKSALYCKSTNSSNTIRVSSWEIITRNYSLSQRKPTCGRSASTGTCPKAITRSIASNVRPEGSSSAPEAEVGSGGRRGGHCARSERDEDEPDAERDLALLSSSSDARPREYSRNSPACTRRSNSSWLTCLA